MLVKLDEDEKTSNNWENCGRPNLIFKKKCMHYAGIK